MNVTAQSSSSTASAAVSCIPFWAFLSESQRQELAAGCRIRSYAAGENIYYRHSGGDGLVVVLDGRMRVFIASDSGREVTLFFVGRGELLVLSVLSGTGEGDTVPVVQAEGACLLAFVESSVIMPLVESCPAVCRAVFGCLSAHIRHVLNTIDSNSFGTLRSRIAKLILEKLRVQAPLYAVVPVTHEEIANHLGTTREVISRELEALGRTGIIRTGRRKITVVDREGLRALAFRG